MTAHRDPNQPAYDNPVGNKGGNVLADEKKARPKEGQHVGKAETEGQHDQRPKHRPDGHPSDEKLGRKPAA